MDGGAKGPGTGGRNVWDRRAEAAAAAAVAFAALAVVGGPAKSTALAIVGGVLAFICASLVVWFRVRSNRTDDAGRLAAEDARERERQLRLLRCLATTRPDRQHVPRFAELSAYELGVDVEESLAPEYIARDQDEKLGRAVASVQHSNLPRMVVLHGPSKAGKSRTLFEAVRGNQALHQAAVLVPHDVDCLSEFLQGEGPPELPPEAPVIVWLDDLERFVAAGRRGMHLGALDDMTHWGRQVVVLATAGGKGAQRLAETGLAVPIQQLYRHPRVDTVSLWNDLSADERQRVRERYPATVAEQIVAHGLGEYLVAAPELARKLINQVHVEGARPSPEGAAVAWAAIDWARSGMVTSIERKLLRELWPHYLHGRPPSDENFKRGLEWALEPIFTSISLISETASYEAYDWIVSHVDHELGRRIDDSAWRRIIEAVDPEAALQVGVTAYSKQFIDGSERAFTRAAEAPDPLVAGRAAFNLGVVLEEKGDLPGAEAAYQRALASRQGEPATKAAANLALLCEERGQFDEAEAAYRQAMSSSTPQQGSLTAVRLGLMLARRGQVVAAADALEYAIGHGTSEVAGRAAVLLGDLFEQHGSFAEARNAYERASSLAADATSTVAAQIALGRLCARNGEVVAARAAYERAAASEHPSASTAKDLLVGLDRPAPPAPVQNPPPSVDVHGAAQAAGRRAQALEQAGDVGGARAAYEEAIATGVSGVAPAAAMGLAMLLEQSGDRPEAYVAYERARAFGDEKFSSAAALSLGRLFLEDNDIVRARNALREASESPIADVASAARSLLETTS